MMQCLQVLSPGVPLCSPVVQEALQAGVSVTSELAFASQLLSQEDIRIAAVTGTNGKSSVTHFASTLLESAGVKVWAGGNLGIPVSTLALGIRQGTKRVPGWGMFLCHGNVR